jgi:hypothetical protein
MNTVVAFAGAVQGGAGPSGRSLTLVVRSKRGSGDDAVRTVNPECRPSVSFAESP